MKPKLKNSGLFYRSALFFMIVLASHDRTTAADITGDTVTTDLTVSGNTTGTGWGLFKSGVYFGQSSESMLSWNSDPVYPTTTGTILFDIVRPKGIFTWRQSPTVGTAVNKMSIDENNILTLYKAPNPAGTTPAAGVTINPETGVINLTGTGTSSGITYNGTSLFSLDAATGKITFASNRPAVIGSLVASTGSTSGALVVRGGIGVGQDSYFNGVKIGRGANGGGMAFSNLAVGTIQAFIDTFMKDGGADKIDYVHGADVVGERTVAR